MVCTHAKGASESTLQAYALAARLSAAVATEKTDWRPNCSVCGSSDAACCLECSHLGCVQHGRHAPNHNLGVCLWPSSQGYLWCFECQNLILDPDFEELRKRELVFTLSGHRPSVPDSTTFKQLKHPQYHALQGLKGFYNMGATCYMAVILQSLIHNPIVNQFFLSGGHDNSLCSKSNCVQCCVDHIFCEFFGGDTVESCGLAELLLAVVKNSTGHFSGATEQDAHEFMQFLLNQFHDSHYTNKAYERLASSFGDVVNTLPDGPKCPCVAHRTFTGILQNTLRCESCHFVKHTTDLLLDLSLEIKGSHLRDCLAQFTASEKISHYKCSNCNEQGHTLKKILIKNLPPVLHIQLKRFKHMGVSSKDEQRVSFELYLDMSPYTATQDEHRPFIYELFGVVCHQGSLDTGHYTCIMKHRSGVWYHFDDTVVTVISPENVLKSSAYLLFYSPRWTV